MPLPKPEGDESKKDFLSRCMGDTVMNDDFPDTPQRYAVCLKQWESSKGREVRFADTLDARRQAEIRDYLATFARGDLPPPAKWLSLHRTRIKGQTPTGPVITFVLFSEGVKRDGDEFVVAGADLTHIRANPRVMWAHDYSDVPVGNWLRIERVHDARLGHIIEGDAAPLRTDDGSEAAERSQTIFRLYANHDLDACSGGWISHEIEPRTNEEGLCCGLRHVRSEVLEGSLVPIGADPVALQRAIQQRRVPEKYVELFVRKPGATVYTVRDIPELEPTIGKQVSRTEALEICDKIREAGVEPPAPDIPIEEKPTSEPVESTTDATPEPVEPTTDATPEPEIRTVSEQSSEKEPAVHTRIGAVISAKNKTRITAALTSLRTAADTLDELLREAFGEDDDEDEDEDETEPETMAQPAPPALDLEPITRRLEDLAYQLTALREERSSENAYRDLLASVRTRLRERETPADRLTAVQRRLEARAAAATIGRLSARLRALEPQSDPASDATTT